MIKLKSVTKQYPYGARVLDSLDMTINDGEIIALLGGEQSGKTTFLKAVAGVTDCDGEILFNGESLQKKPDDVIMVFDDLAIFENRSCFYNLAYPLKIRGIDKQEIAKRVKLCADKLGIVACLYDKAKNTSLIDKKRLAVARLFLRESKVILVDDITRGLSKEESSELWQEVAPILKQKAKSGTIVIFSTCDKDEAVSIADRIAVLHYGEIKQIGNVQEICERPKSIWAGEALDSDYHFEPATLDVCDGVLVAKTRDGYSIDVNYLADKVVKSYIGKDVLIGWRSDCFDVDGDRQVDVEYALKGVSDATLVCSIGRIKTTKSVDKTGTLPVYGKASLFDDTNENSILKG